MLPFRVVRCRFRDGFFQQSSKHVSIPPAEEMNETQRSQPQLTVVFDEHVTSRQVCDRGCQTANIFPSSDVNVHSSQEVPARPEFCRIDLRRADASSFLIMNRMVTRRQSHDQHLRRHTPRWNSFPPRRPLEVTNHLPDVVFRFLAVVFGCPLRTHHMSPTTLLPAKCSSDTWNACLLLQLVISATP